MDKTPLLIPLVEGETPPSHKLEAEYHNVTMEEHLELLKSPKKCKEIGVDFWYERAIYEHRRMYNNFPPLPPINIDEQDD